jgi:hypothetical protein
MYRGIILGWGEIEPLGTVAANRQVIDERTECWWNNNWQGKTEILEEKPSPVQLCTPQVPHGLSWD